MNESDAIYGDNQPIRMFIALRILRAWTGCAGADGFNSTVVCTVHDWIDGGMRGPLPWPNSPFFDEWAAKRGYRKIDGKYVGFILTGTIDHIDTGKAAQ